jgi:ABC-type bacteriocin/lantibiotic exporter with double-glycine peptidase domain
MDFTEDDKLVDQVDEPLDSVSRRRTHRTKLVDQVDKPLHGVSQERTESYQSYQEEDASQNDRISPDDGYAVVFSNVSFAYTGEDGKKVIDDLSLNIEKGRITVLAGESGCGKSTVMKLMLGLYTPDSGSVDALQRKGYVPQDSYLLPVSVKENILCSLSFEEEKFISACKSAGIWDFITGLPDGYDTVLTESAANISGGQKQRIAIARAFYQDPDLLLMDESTSALDPATEQLVLQEFCDYIKNTGKTAVVVAHRQSVIDLADNVIALTKGA